MGVLTLVMRLLEVVSALLKANGDHVAEEEAMMIGQEVLKAELDRRKFGP
ncbi:MAG TPA: hypothetical protein VFB89_06275 [Gemmatimonadales bacterium]|nr:hypothetical protein [Gemmatimonadales bacterium]